MTNLADIAAALREHSPGVLPESLTIEDSCGAPGLYAHGVYLHDDIAAAVLIACMVQDGGLDRDVTSEWSSFGLRPGAYDDDCCCGYERRAFRDSGHGGSLGACYQAWRWSKGLPAA